MAISITTFTPNTKAQSSQVNANFSNIVTAIDDVSHRGYSWGVIGTLLTGDMQGMQYIVPVGVNAVTVWGKTTSGTATCRIQADAIDILTAFNATSLVSSTSTMTSIPVTAGQVLSLDITAASGVDLFVTLETQVTSIT